MSVATVIPISKNRIRIEPALGYSIVLFKLADDSAEAVVIDRNSVETTRLALAPAGLGRRIEIIRGEDGAFEVLYRDR